MKPVFNNYEMVSLNMSFMRNEFVYKVKVLKIP